MSLMWTFRGIPTLYYGSEIEFQAGKQIDCGPTCPLATTGRAYYGDHLAGSVTAADFGVVGSASGAVATTLHKPLVKHLQRLNQIRRAVPALQKGQYSTEGISGAMAYKRRYTSGAVDSFALVTVSGGATFTGIPNGTYMDAVTGDVKTVTDGTLTATRAARATCGSTCSTCPATRRRARSARTGRTCADTGAAGWRCECTTTPPRSEGIRRGWPRRAPARRRERPVRGGGATASLAALALLLGLGALVGLALRAALVATLAVVAGPAVRAALARAREHARLGGLEHRVGLLLGELAVGDGLVQPLLQRGLPVLGRRPLRPLRAIALALLVQLLQRRGDLVGRDAQLLGERLGELGLPVGVLLAAVVPWSVVLLALGDGWALSSANAIVGAAIPTPSTPAAARPASRCFFDIVRIMRSSNVR